MKTSILISSFAALCILLTFAEAPRRNSVEKRSIILTENSAIEPATRAILLPGIVITAERKKDVVNTFSVTSTDDYSYLKFNVNDYSEMAAMNPEEYDVLPEATESDFSYLKFEFTDYYTVTATDSFNAIEMPEE
jgi:hypothetical protein